ncbi:hypothetical protein J4476_01185 [Candidatus Woesearchaeota archaeon]|nr:MAG: hypothetical protein QT09_C0014G0073 [archaeon GW2011_AR18]MBS3161292.1 hypothetical protein [Candidatus Woesearchaeota archaeon]HIH25758.1 hypothetical protein [Nanoarchaeota archaeon]
MGLFRKYWVYIGCGVFGACSGIFEEIKHSNDKPIEERPYVSALNQRLEKEKQNKLEVIASGSSQPLDYSQDYILSSDNYDSK